MAARKTPTPDKTAPVQAPKRREIYDFDSLEAFAFTVSTLVIARGENGKKLGTFPLEAPPPFHEPEDLVEWAEGFAAALADPATQELLRQGLRDQRESQMNGAGPPS